MSLMSSDHNNDQIATQPQHNDSNNNKKIIFITVGTTLFNELIKKNRSNYSSHPLYKKRIFSEATNMNMYAQLHPIL